MTMFKYIEIIKYETKEVVKRVDVSHLQPKSIDRYDDGLNINLNHNEYYTRIVESYNELKTITT